MKLLISFFIALAIFLLGALIINLLKKLVERYGYSVVTDAVFSCCLIALLTLMIYLMF